MANQNLTFIHFSDIHFNKNSGDNYDLDSDLRNEIIEDIKREYGKIDRPSGILICGDIAYSGKKIEYDNAITFLNELCQLLSIQGTDIFCVPGNHDVDQDVPKNSSGFRDMQAKIENASDLDENLAAFLRDPVCNSILFQHIHEYNKFAGKYFCNIYHEKPFQYKDFKLNDGSILRVRSLNSVIISNHLDKRDRLMVLGQYQIRSREDGVTEMTLCHHPPECWKDSENTKNKINERYRIQLYGHKHIQKVRQVNNSLIIGSGATHPSRSEDSWRPRYNWLSVCVDGIGDNRELKVKIYPRVLNDTNDRYIADSNNCDGNSFVEYSLKLDKWDNHNKVELSGEKDMAEEISPETEKVETVTNIKSNPERSLVYRFLAISFITRSRILSELDLVDEEDEGIEHINLLDKILQKAKKDGKLADLWDKISQALEEPDIGNPFINNKTKEGD